MKDKYKIEITAPKSPIACANLMYSYRRKEKELTPEFCLTLLHACNNRKIMRDMLTLIAEHLEQHPEEYKSYRPILYGVICGREQPEEIINKTSEIALANINLDKADKEDRDFAADLNKIKKEDGLHKKISTLSAKLLKKIPIDVKDIAEDMAQKILEGKESPSVEQLANYALAEIPQKRQNKNIFARLYNKIRMR